MSSWRARAGLCEFSPRYFLPSEIYIPLSLLLYGKRIFELTSFFNTVQTESGGTERRSTKWDLVGAVRGTRHFVVLYY
jgi:hypothetical protein